MSATAERKILFLQYTNPCAYPPLEHASIILTRRGWRARFLGTAAPDTASIAFPPNPAIELDMMPFAGPGWRQKLHFARFCWRALVETWRWRPAAVYASDLLACPAALLVSLLTRAEVFYHEHDSPEPALNGGRVGGENLFQRALRWTRRRVAARAVACILPNGERARLFREETKTPKPVLVVWNCPRLDEVGPAREPRQGRVWLLYHGTLGPERLPEHLIDLLPGGLGLRFAGYETLGTRGYVERLRQRAASLDCLDRFDYAGTIPVRAGLLAICRSAHIGISIPPPRARDLNLRHMAGASNKAFDYLACGLPIVVPDAPEWRELFCAAGVAVPCDPADPASFEAAVNALASEPGRLEAMGEAGRRRILSDWNYEKQFQPVLEKLEALR